MLLEEDIQKVLDRLAEGELIKLSFDGSDIIIRSLEDFSKVYLMTSVYYGGNYIPSSVRRCLSQKAPVPHPSIKTYLTVDEQHFQVHLNYLGQTQALSQETLKDLLEEFGRIADNWRLYLDEHDKNDLVYVHIKR